jgi:hypothetical protein
MKPTCPFCLKEFDVAGDEFVKHVSVCNESKKQQEAAAKKQVLDKEKALRTKELDAAYNNFETLLYKYQSDYHEVPIFYYDSTYPFGDVIALLKNWTGAR